MKLLTFKRPGRATPQLGAMIQGGLVVDLPAVCALMRESGEVQAPWRVPEAIPNRMIDFIEQGEASLYAARLGVERAENDIPEGKRVGMVLPEEEVHFLPPVQTPSKMISVGANYRDHLDEVGLEAPDFPMAFSKLPSAFLGHRGKIPFSPKTRKLDYEIELAFVIGKKGKYIDPKKAMKYVYGYTIFNDISERQLQVKEMQAGTLFGGKNMDGFAPIGPYLVTADEIKDPHNLDMTLRVNGEVRQSSNTGNMIYRIEDLISYWSNLMTLWPGDVVSTGTPSGVAVGKGLESSGYLQPGDKIEAEIESLGVLQNEVVSEQVNVSA